MVTSVSRRGGAVRVARRRRDILARAADGAARRRRVGDGHIAILCEVGGIGGRGVQTVRALARHIGCIRADLSVCAVRPVDKVVASVSRRGGAVRGARRRRDSLAFSADGAARRRRVGDGHSAILGKVGGVGGRSVQAVRALARYIGCIRADGIAVAVRPVDKVVASFGRRGGAVRGARRGRDSLARVADGAARRRRVGDGHSAVLGKVGGVGGRGVQAVRALARHIGCIRADGIAVAVRPVDKVATSVSRRGGAVRGARRGCDRFARAADGAARRRRISDGHIAVLGEVGGIGVCGVQAVRALARHIGCIRADRDVCAVRPVDKVVASVSRRGGAVRGARRRRNRLARAADGAARCCRVGDGHIAVLGEVGGVGGRSVQAVRALARHIVCIRANGIAVAVRPVDKVVASVSRRSGAERGARRGRDSLAGAADGSARRRRVGDGNLRLLRPRACKDHIGGRHVVAAISSRGHIDGRPAAEVVARQRRRGRNRERIADMVGGGLCGQTRRARGRIAVLIGHLVVDRCPRADKAHVVVRHGIGAVHRGYVAGRPAAECVTGKRGIVSHGQRCAIGKGANLRRVAWQRGRGGGRGGIVGVSHRVAAERPRCVERFVLDERNRARHPSPGSVGGRDQTAVRALGPPARKGVAFAGKACAVVDVHACAGLGRHGGGRGGNGQVCQVGQVVIIAEGVLDVAPHGEERPTALHHQQALVARLIKLQAA